jgi:hypothetical protein
LQGRAREAAWPHGRRPPHRRRRRWPGREHASSRTAAGPARAAASRRKPSPSFLRRRRQICARCRHESGSKLAQYFRGKKQKHRKIIRDRSPTGAGATPARALRRGRAGLSERSAWLRLQSVGGSERRAAPARVFVCARSRSLASPPHFLYDFYMFSLTCPASLTSAVPPHAHRLSGPTESVCIDALEHRRLGPPVREICQ